MFNILRPLSIVVAATFVLVVASGLLDLGAFGVATVIGTVGLAVVLSVAAFAALAVVTIAVCLPLGIETPGIMLHTVFGIAAGTITLGLFGMFWPNLVMLGFVGAIPYAAVNTGLIWLLAYGTGSAKPNPVMPVFRRK
jgi:hypothetical protein